MKSIWTQLLLLFVSLALAPRLASAQGVDPTPASPMGAPAAGSSFGQHEVLASLILVAVTVLVLLAIGKVSDLRQRREEERADLETRIGSALLEHADFVRSSVGPIVRIPFWRGSPATIEMVGRAPSAQLEQSALRIAAEAAARVRWDYSIENRMTPASSSAIRATGAKGEAYMAHRFVEALKTFTTVVGVLTGVVLLKYAILIEHLNLH